MPKLSDRELKLRREIKELKEQNYKLAEEVRILKRRLEKEEPKVTTKAKKKTSDVCPECGAAKKVSSLPFGKLEICSAACGWRLVTND